MAKKQQKQKEPKLEMALRDAMSALDRQIARAMQRSPEQRSIHGVEKWKPISERIEQVSSFIINNFGEEEVQLDSILVLSQAYAKTLSLILQELGPEGLGELRSAYALSALEHIERDVRNAQQVMADPAQLIN